MIIQVYPAYGRRYFNAGLMQSAWDAGEEFELSAVHQAQLKCGPHINKRDFEKYSDAYGITGVDLKCGSVLVSIKLRSQP